MKRRRFIHAAGIGTLAVLAPRLSRAKNDEQNYHIEQFKDKGLAHYSYAVLSGDNLFIIDPGRDTREYYDFAKQRGVKITGIIETHPHADFASAHLEIHNNGGATIYASSLTKPAYPFQPFDDGQVIQLSKTVKLRSLFTPGHAPDHISVVLNENGKDIAVFSGDSLLIGDVGRPDLREQHTDALTQRKRLAAQMYHTINDKFAKLDDDVIVYPAHGAGSLCGKAMRDAPSSTIGYEKAHNYAFEPRSEDAFVALLLADLPFIPKYFAYDVTLNIHGVTARQQGIDAVPRLEKNYAANPDALIIDGRPATVFKQSYQSGAINLQDGGRFETWLGSVVAPETHFYLVAADTDHLQTLIGKAAKIGYEPFIKGAFVYDAQDGNHFTAFDVSKFDPKGTQYTIIDVRTEKEAKEEKIFGQSINIPLQDLAKRIGEVPTDKPILVTCSSGYRSAAGSSILKKYLPGQEIFDLGTAVTQFEQPAK